MQIHRSRRSLLSTAVALALGCVIAAAPVGETHAQAKTQVRVGGAGAGGLFYLVAGGMVNLVNKYSTTVQATLQATNGGVENARLTESGQLDLSMVTEDVVDHAWRGTDEFKQPMKNLRLLFKGHPTVYTFVTLAKTDIRSLQDLKGRMVTFGPPGAGGTLAGERILAMAGLKLGADYRAQVMAYGQQNDALKDGRVDAAFNGGLVPIPQLVELSTSQPIRLLPIAPELVQKYAASYGKYFTPTVIPANAFKGQDRDIPAINFGFANFVVRAGLPDAVAEEIIRVVSEHTAELVNVHPAGKYYTAREIFNGGATYVPVHPGAISYLRKIGMWDKRPAGVMEAPR